jgi:hypothetical protein
MPGVLPNRASGDQKHPMAKVALVVGIKTPTLIIAERPTLSPKRAVFE